MTKTTKTTSVEDFIENLTGAIVPKEVQDVLDLTRFTEHVLFRTASTKNYRKEALALLAKHALPMATTGNNAAEMEGRLGLKLTKCAYCPGKLVKEPIVTGVVGGSIACYTFRYRCRKCGAGASVSLVGMSASPPERASE